jgi:hypothetical protein
MKISRGAFLALTAARAMAMAQQGAMGNGHEGMYLYIYDICMLYIYIPLYTNIPLQRPLTISKRLDMRKDIIL